MLDRQPIGRFAGTPAVQSNSYIGGFSGGSRTFFCVLWFVSYSSVWLAEARLIIVSVFNCLLFLLMLFIFLFFAYFIKIWGVFE